MKFYSSSLPELLLKIQKKQIKSILIHGINHGLAATIIKQIIFILYIVFLFKILKNIIIELEWSEVLLLQVWLNVLRMLHM